MGIGFLLIGPSYYWGIQENIWVMLSGISILGFSASFSIIPLMPLIMTEIKSKFVKNTSTYIDSASSLYNSAFGLGSILGPLVGAHLSSYFGFRICTDILSHFSGLLFLVLIFTGNYWRILGFIREESPKKKNTMLERPTFDSHIESPQEARNRTFSHH
jgi:MFS family permease